MRRSPAMAENDRFKRFLKASAATFWPKRSSMARIPIMKSKHSFASTVLLVLIFGCAMFIGTLAQGGARHRSNYFEPGRLTIERSPNFGWNLGYHLQIDGRPAGSVAQGHSYSILLPPGPHVLTVLRVPAMGYIEPTSTTVNIQPGTEHLYQAMWDAGLVYLHPAGLWLTPGAYWQNRGNGVP